jgi:hypothetical protein
LDPNFELPNDYRNYCNKILQNNKNHLVGIECVGQNHPMGVDFANNNKYELNSALLSTLFSQYTVIDRENFSNINAPQTVFTPIPNKLPIIVSSNFIDKYEDIISNINSILTISDFNSEIIPINETSIPNVPEEQPTTIDAFINNPANVNVHQNRDKIKIMMVSYSFFRSYIDFYHDFEYLAIKYIPYLKLHASLVSHKLGQQQEWFTNKLIEIDKTVTTNSNNVNQKACKKLLIQYLEEYSKYLINLGVYWLIPNKESALVSSANINNPQEIMNFTSKLKNDFITHFYIETDKSHAAEMLIKNGFDMVKSISGIRDAGSGISDKTALSYAINRQPKLNIISISRTYNSDAKSKIIFDNNNLIINNVGSDFPSEYLFNDAAQILINNGLTSNNNITITSNLTKNSLLLSGTNEKCEQLSVNSLLATIQEPKLRGLSEGSANPPINIAPTSNLTERDKILFLILKTFTDFIQLLDIYDIKDINGIRTSFVTLDMLCESSGMLFGLNTILSESGFVSNYCYDIRYHSVDRVRFIKKLKVVLYVKQNIEELKVTIVNKFNNIYNYIDRMNKFHYNPAVYYSTYTLLNDISEIREKALARLNDAFIINLDANSINFVKTIPDTVKEYIEQICEMTVIKASYQNVYNNLQQQINIISRISTHENENTFIELYYIIKQQIINSLPTKIDTNLLNLHVNIFFAIVTLSRARPEQIQTIIMKTQLKVQLNIH